MSFFDDAWVLLKQSSIMHDGQEIVFPQPTGPQIELSDAERDFVPMARAGGANDSRNLQSNLGLFDPSLALQTIGPNFQQNQIRIGRGQPVPRAPQIES